MPNTEKNAGGISRKISDQNQRRKLKIALESLDIAEGQSVIIRTAGEGKEKQDIQRDYDYLNNLWHTIRALTLESSAPALVYEEGDLIKRSLRDIYTDDVKEIIVAGKNSHEKCKKIMHHIMPPHVKKIKLYKDIHKPIFQKYNIENILHSIYEPVVALPSGGYIVINQTEALVAIDVNSGKATKERHIHETAYKTNLEAAVEISRQLKFRDLSGLIVIDFIDMPSHHHQMQVEKKLKEALRYDRARIQIGRISRFGLLEMSRQRLRPSLLETTSHPCPHCQGKGFVRSLEAVCLDLLRQIEHKIQKEAVEKLKITLSQSLFLHLINHYKSRIDEIENKYSVILHYDIDSNVQDFTLNIINKKPVTAKEAQKSVAGKDTQKTHQHTSSQESILLKTSVAGKNVTADVSSQQENDAQEKNTSSKGHNKLHRNTDHKKEKTSRIKIVEEKSPFSIIHSFDVPSIDSLPASSGVADMMNSRHKIAETSFEKTPLYKESSFAIIHTTENIDFLLDQLNPTPSLSMEDSVSFYIQRENIHSKEKEGEPKEKKEPALIEVIQSIDDYSALLQDLENAPSPSQKEIRKHPLKNKSQGKNTQKNQSSSKNFSQKTKNTSETSLDQETKNTSQTPLDKESDSSLNKEGDKSFLKKRPRKKTSFSEKKSQKEDIMLTIQPMNLMGVNDQPDAIDKNLSSASMRENTVFQEDKTVFQENKTVSKEESLSLENNEENKEKALSQNPTTLSKENTKEKPEEKKKGRKTAKKAAPLQRKKASIDKSSSSPEEKLDQSSPDNKADTLLQDNQTTLQDNQTNEQINLKENHQTSSLKKRKNTKTSLKEESQIDPLLKDKPTENDAKKNQSENLAQENQIESSEVKKKKTPSSKKTKKNFSSSSQAAGSNFDPPFDSKQKEDGSSLQNQKKTVDQASFSSEENMVEITDLQNEPLKPLIKKKKVKKEDASSSKPSKK